MAAPAVDIIYSVFLPGRMVLSQSAVDYQLAHADDFNCEGLNTYTIALMSVVTLAVALRLWSRKVAGIDWRSDDYTLVAGWVRLYFPCTVPILASRSGSYHLQMLHINHDST